MLYKIKTLSQLNLKNLKNKSVLLRIDINSPLVKGKILDNLRFKSAARTIKYLIKQKAKIAIIAHQGRKGDRDFSSLKQHTKILSKYVGRKVTYVDDLFGQTAKRKICLLNPSEVIILKNVRDYDDEINIKLKNNRYKEFSKLFELYINEAFSVSHREHGSIMLPPKYLPSYIGFEFEKELFALQKFKSSNAKNKIFILGGTKIEDYLSLFKFLKNKNNKVLAAGILANLFLIIKGYNLGYESKWLRANNYFKYTKQLKNIYNKYKTQIILPIDLGSKDNKGRRINVLLEQAPYKYKIYDVGEKTANLFINYINKADYIFMKGPLGFSEILAFSYSTRRILNDITNLTKNKHVFSIIAGGHLTTTINKYKIKNNFSHISLAGGALIKYISGGELPGIKALEKIN